MALHPNTYTYYNSKRLKILDSLPITEKIQKIYSSTSIANINGNISRVNPGTILFIEKNAGIIVQTADYPLLITKAQLESKKPAEGTQIIQQLNPKIGEILGS